MKELLLIIAIVLIGLLVIGYGFVERFVFFPPTAAYTDSDKIIKIPVDNGGVIAAIYLSNPKATYVVLISHGNAEDLGNLYPLMHAFQRHGFSVLAYDYQGYGLSSGVHSEKQTYADIDAAYQYLIKKKHYSPDKLIIFGSSLGAAVSLDLAVRKPVAGLILQSPFASVFRVLTRIPLLPFSQYNNRAKINKLTCPLLVIHGINDEIMPVWHGKELYAAYKGKKMSYWVQGAGHNDIAFVGGETYWQIIQKFADTLN